MRETLIAVVGTGLLVGGCSLSSPGGPVTTSSLRGNSAPLVISSGAPTGLGPVIEDKPDRPVETATRGGIDPTAALTASERARTKWENLKPSDLTKIPAATGRAAPETTSTLAAASAARATNGNYDRDAAMQNLVNGGKTAGKPICNGC